MSAVNIGIASGKFEGTLHGRPLPAHDPLEAIVVYFDDGRTPAALIALDLGFLSIPTAAELRQQLARRCHLPVETIVTHCTHTHTAPWDQDVRTAGIDSWADVLAPVVTEARRRALPAEMAFVEMDTGRQFNLNRRQRLPGGLGSLCVHMGFEGGAARPDGGPLNRARLRQWLGREITEPELLGPMIYDAPTDGWLQGLFFRAMNGEPIGSVVRFASHPAVAGHTTQRQMSADFPGVVRQRVEQAFGGVCAYLTGPCGNTSAQERGRWPPVPPLVEDPAGFSLNVPWLPQTDPLACWGERERIGNGIADALLSRLPASGDFEPCHSLDVRLRQVDLPLRFDLPVDLSEVGRLLAAERERFLKTQRTSSLPEVKAMADRINFLSFIPLMDGWYRLSPGQIRSRQARVDLPMLRIGNIVCLGFPGETFWETPQAARRTAGCGGLKFLGFTEANGDIGYIPTEEERPFGDYECYCSITAAGAEKQLSGAAAEMVKAMVG